MVFFFCCWIVGNLQVRWAHFTLAALGITPFLALFTHLCAVRPTGKSLTLLLRHWRKHSVHACAYFGPSRSHACSPGAIFNQPRRRMRYEFCLSDSWRAVTLTRSLLGNTRQVMSAGFHHRAYISVIPFSYRYSTDQICFITLRRVTGGAVFQPAAEYLSLCEFFCHAEKYCITERQSCHSAQNGPTLYPARRW